MWDMCIVQLEKCSRNSQTISHYKWSSQGMLRVSTKFDDHNLETRHSWAGEEAAEWELRAKPGDGCSSAGGAGKVTEQKDSQGYSAGGSALRISSRLSLWALGSPCFTATVLAIKGQSQQSHLYQLKFIWLWPESSRNGLMDLHVQKRPFPI